jgi:hypothetical protein
VQLSHFFGCLQYPGIFIPLRQTLFLETVRSHSGPNQENRAGVPFQQLIFGPETALRRVSCETEHCHGGESDHWVKGQDFSNAQFHVTASIFPYNKLG